MNLANHFLIAMPHLEEDPFKRSVIYLCEHSAEGAMGIIINLPLDMTVEKMLEEIEIDPITPTSALRQPLMNGGPMAEDRGFILHKTQNHKYESTLTVSEEIQLTSSRDMLEALANNTAPENFLVSLGYCSWKTGQLEQELADNIWLTIEANVELLFSAPIAERWGLSLATFGVNPANLSSQIGHA
jgi:putative transcriptional regulator